MKHNYEDYKQSPEESGQAGQVMAVFVQSQSVHVLSRCHVNLLNMQASYSTKK